MTIIEVIGESGSGKSSLTWLAQERGIVPTVVSYTTRPMREGEVNGREHWFVKPEDKPDDLLAYTNFGGYEYWTTLSQLKSLGDIFTYVIDEDGADFLENNDSLEDVDLVLVKVRRDDKAGIDADRQSRDEGRFKYPDEFYDYVISNDGTMDELVQKLADIVDEVKSDNELVVDAKCLSRDGLYVCNIRLPLMHRSYPDRMLLMFAKRRVYTNYGYNLGEWIGFCENTGRNKHILDRQGHLGIRYSEIGDRLMYWLRDVVIEDVYDLGLPSVNSHMHSWFDSIYIDHYFKQQARDNDGLLIQGRFDRVHVSTMRILCLVPEGIKYVVLDHNFALEHPIVKQAISVNTCLPDHFVSTAEYTEYEVWHKNVEYERFWEVKKQANYIAGLMYNLM